MSKYVIEIEEKPLCVFDKDTQTFFPRLWRVKGFNSLVLDEEGLSRLEELNSDYINEHFGDLQDTAYQKGINDGSLDVKQRVEGAYQKGFEDGKAVHDKGCEGCKYANVAGTHEPCVRCSNSYGNQWTAKADKIGVGDVVETKSGTIFVVTKITTDGFVVGFNGDGNTCCFDITKLTKTGEHYNINEILGGLCDD